MNEALAGALLAACVIAPGWAVVRALDLVHGALPTFVVAVAVGRVLFAATTLLATAVGGRPLLLAFALAATTAAVVAESRQRRALRGRRAEEAGSVLARVVPPALAFAASLWLVHAVVARSGLENAAGELVFYGRDSTNDPLVYGAVAQRLARVGLPLVLPFAADWPAPGSYGHYAVEAGLHLVSGASMLDLSFRVLPLFDTATMTLTGVALTRALGGGALAAAAAGVLLVLGCEASFLVAPVAALFGRATQLLDSWALFDAYLLPFNPGGPALQTFFAAALLVAQPAAGASRDAEEQRRRPRETFAAHGVVAGLLVAALFEWKVFLWAPVLASLVAVAWWRPPPAVKKPLRLAALCAVLGSAPSLLDRAIGSQAATGGDETGLVLCALCLPRYLANAAWGTGELSFALFRDFLPSNLLQPYVLTASVLASLCVVAVALGARLAALPTLWRGARGADATAAVLRWIGLAALLGLGGSLLLATRPHYLNGSQLAWAATFGLWPVAALQLERWTRARRFVAAALVLGLALPGSAAVLGRLGYGAPVWMRVSAEERALLSQLAAFAGPHDVVLEPSMLMDTDRPSPLPWLAGQPVYLSLLSAVQSLPEAERNRRFDELVAVFAGTDEAAAARAIETSGARFVYAPLGWRLRFEPGPLLEPILRGPAGVIYEVRAAQAGSSGALRRQ